MGLGEASITARFGSLTSQPIKVKVASGHCGLVANRSKTIRLRVGEEAQLGDDIVVFPRRRRREPTVQDDLLAARVRPLPARDEEPARRVAGHSQVAFALGDKSCNMTVEVAPAESAATADAWSDLRIQPKVATMHPGEALRYEATAVKGGLRRVLGKEDGVALTVSDGTVAQVLDGLAVGAVRPGQTSVIAKLAGQTAEASLEVTPGKRLAADATVIDGGVVYLPDDVSTPATAGSFSAPTTFGACCAAGERVQRRRPGGRPRQRRRVEIVPAPGVRLVVSPEKLSLWRGEPES